MSKSNLKSSIDNVQTSIKSTCGTQEVRNEQLKADMNAGLRKKSRPPSPAEAGHRHGDPSASSGRQGKTTDWIQTFTGKKFFPMEPEPGDICIEDIAHALSNICRFTGHCKRFYSVAMHSILGASWLRNEGFSNDVALGFLLHDASEAYLCDVPRPLKKAWPWYRETEKTLQNMIYKKFLGGEIRDERKEFDEIIRQTDNDMLFWEACELMNYDEHVDVWKTTFTEEDFWRFHKPEFQRFARHTHQIYLEHSEFPNHYTKQQFLQFFKELE